MKHTLFYFLILLLLSACSHRVIPASNIKESQDELLLPVLWYQKSGEMRALYIQCYRNAKRALEEKTASANDGKPLAVVLDIDETILDNSPFEAWLILNEVQYSEELWNKWVVMEKAKALPGALSFTRFADSLGVTLFYVSNRSSSVFDATVRNLSAEGFPGADSVHVMLMGENSSKVSRRNRISDRYNIVLLIGDSLSDFDGIWEKRPDAPSFDTVDGNEALFGTSYIILPNPMYGTWLNEILKKGKGAGEVEKMKNLLNAY